LLQYYYDASPVNQRQKKHFSQRDTY